MTAFVFERAMFMLQGSYKYFILIVDLVFWIMFSSCGFVYFIYLWFPKQHFPNKLNMSIKDKPNGLIFFVEYINTKNKKKH